MMKAGAFVVVLFVAYAQVALAQPDPAGMPPNQAQTQDQGQKERERLKEAAELVKNKKVDEAAKKLRETVDDKNSSNAAKRTALSLTAWYYWKTGDNKKGAEYYRKVLDLPSVGDRERVDDLARFAHLAPSEAVAAEFDKFIQEHPKAAPANVARARYEKGRTYVLLKKPKEATAAFDSVLAMKDVPFKWIREASLGLGDVAVVQDDKQKAIAIYQAFLRRPWTADFPYDSVDRLVDIERLIVIAPGLDVTPEVAAYLNELSLIRDFQLSSYAPKNDVLYAIQGGRVKQGDDLLKGTERYKLYLSENPKAERRYDPADVNKQLWSGEKKLRPFVTSDFSKALAKQILPSAPLGDYLKPFLAGKYREAAQVAWRHSRLEKGHGDHENWLNAVALAVGSDDQTRGGRREAFLNWVHPDSLAAKASAVKPDALETYLGALELPYEPTAAELAAAAAHLNTLQDILRIDLGHVVRQALADNDVMLVGMESYRAHEAYAAYLWRTTGRVTDAEITAVKQQLDQGGTNQPFKVTESAKKLARMISNDAPLGGYLKLLLNGEHRQAARLAWKKAIAAKPNNPAEYENWRNAVIVAVRCHDQAKEGRVQQFADWTKGKLIGPDGKPVTINPLADFLGE